MPVLRSFSEARNKRVYDPVITNPTFTQDYNAYSYVRNNPLGYVDPSGYILYEPMMTEYFGGVPSSGRDNRLGGGGGGMPQFGRDGVNSFFEWDLAWRAYETRLSGDYKTFNEYVDGLDPSVYGKYDVKGILGNYDFKLVVTFKGDSYSSYDKNLKKTTKNALGYVLPEVQSNSINRRYEYSVIFDATNCGGDWINTAIDHTGKTVGVGILFNDGAKVITKEYVRQFEINQRLAGVKNPKLPSSYNVAKGVGKKLGVLGGVVTGADILYNSELTVSDGINLAMTGISFTGVGAIVSGVWFIADNGLGFITGRSISDRIDAKTPTLDWDW